MPQSFRHAHLFAAIMRLQRRDIVPRAFNLGHILARAVLDIGQAEGGFVIQIGNLRQLPHFGIAVAYARMARAARIVMAKPA